MQDEDFGFIVVCAERYALGRQSYAPYAVQEYIKRNIESLSQKDIDIIIRDIRTSNYWGDENIDKPMWFAFADWLEERSNAVKHGHWIDHNENIWDIYGECSICGFEQGLSDSLKYCPNCGARMDEVVE